MTSMQQSQLPLDSSDAAAPRPRTSHVRLSGRGRNAVTRSAAPALSRQGDADRVDDASDRAAQVPMLLTVRDVESELQLGRTRTYQLLRSGEIPTVRVGERALRVTREDLCRWIASKRNTEAG